MLQSSKTKINTLNKLQSKALQLYSEGLGYSGVGAELGLSEHSVVVILDSAVNTLGARNIIHAASVHFVRLKR